MSAIDQLIAAGPHTQGLDLQGMFSNLSALKESQNRNALIDLQTMEFKANAPQRKLEGANKLSTLEQDGALVMAHQMKQQAESGDPTAVSA